MRNVIVVDDNADITEIVKMTLEDKGHQVICVHSGPELFARLGQQRPDIIFLDIMMPGMDGWEVLKQLRDNPDTASTPVVFLTAKGQNEDMLRGYKKGGDFYIPKPFNGGQLLTAMNLLLGPEKANT